MVFHPIVCWTTTTKGLFLDVLERSCCYPSSRGVLIAFKCFQRSCVCPSEWKDFSTIRSAPGGFSSCHRIRSETASSLLKGMSANLFMEITSGFNNPELLSYRYQHSEKYNSLFDYCCGCFVKPITFFGFYWLCSSLILALLDGEKQL